MAWIIFDDHIGIEVEAAEPDACGVHRLAATPPPLSEGATRFARMQGAYVEHSLEVHPTNGLWRSPRGTLWGPGV